MFLLSIGARPRDSPTQAITSAQTFDNKLCVFLYCSSHKVRTLLSPFPHGNYFLKKKFLLIAFLHKLFSFRRYIYENTFNKFSIVTRNGRDHSKITFLLCLKIFKLKNFPAIVNSFIFVLIACNQQ